MAKLRKNPTESDQERTVRVSRERGARFSRLASKRVSRALKSIRGVGNLSARGSYSYTADQVNKVFTALATELRNANARFTATEQKKAAEEFTV